MVLPYRIKSNFGTSDRKQFMQEVLTQCAVLYVASISLQAAYALQKSENCQRAVMGQNFVQSSQTSAHATQSNSCKSTRALHACNVLYVPSLSVQSANALEAGNALGSADALHRNCQKSVMESELK